METISVYRVCESFRESGDELRSQVAGAKPALKRELHRYHVSGTGRFAFGLAATDRPLFKEMSEVSGKSAPLPSNIRNGDDIERKLSTLELSHSNEATAMDVDKSIATKQNNKRPLPQSNAATKSSAAPNAPNKVPSKAHPGGTRPANNAPNLVVGQSGKQAAMSRLAALGELWPEEEDLPGMSMPVSTSTTPGAYAKDAYDAAARLRKVQTAKRKK
eukprot:gene26825-32412_t